VLVLTRDKGTNVAVATSPTAATTTATLPPSTEQQSSTTIIVDPPLTSAGTASRATAPPSSRVVTTVPPTKPPSTAAPVDDFPAVVKELETKLGAPLHLTEALIGPAYISFTVQQPQNPGNYDTYEWRNGRFGAPSAEKTRGTEEPFTLDGVNLDAPKQLRDVALSQGVEGAYVVSVILTNTFGQPSGDPGAEWILNASSPRRDFQVLSNADGSNVIVR
jgi:hypothetical protein